MLDALQEHCWQWGQRRVASVAIDWRMGGALGTQVTPPPSQAQLLLEAAHRLEQYQALPWASRALVLKPRAHRLPWRQAVRRVDSSGRQKVHWKRK